MTMNKMMKSTASTSVLQSLHERICLLYLMAASPDVDATVAEFDAKAGFDTVGGDAAKQVLWRLAEALYAYEQLNGDVEHPVATEVQQIAGYPGLA